VHRAIVRRQPLSPKESRGAATANGHGQQGLASFYSNPQRLASGGWFNPNALTAAHRSLPFGTRVRVTNRGSGRSVDVTINDRGPYIAGRIIDLSRAAAGVIGLTAQGVGKVSLEVLGH
jgi:rare lipoprotein A